LESLLDDLAPDDAGDVGLARLQRAWPGAVGPAIAEAGRPVAFVDGTLHVACGDATWAHELALLEATLLQRLRAAGVTDVRAIRTRAGAGSRGPGGRAPGRAPRTAPGRPRRPRG
jgi:predicted nucleic acid-binding Zn ribbon protein